MKMKSMMGYKKGGKVKRTGAAMLHRGEVVLSVKQIKSLKNKIFKYIKSHLYQPICSKPKS